MIIGYTIGDSPMRVADHSRRRFDLTLSQSPL